MEETPLSIVRLQSPVSSDELACHIFGSRDRFLHLSKLWKLVEEDPSFSKVGRNDKNHGQRYTDACRKIQRYKEVLDEARASRGGQQLSLDEMYDLYIAIDENLPIDVHLSMFIPLMMYHTSPEQKERWLDDALHLRIIGAYAQTELAHGSNVRGIETEAVYDSSSQTFDLHSPTLTSLKWWPGGLGHTATHAVVYANLIIERKNYGVHAFMVQLRDLQNHFMMPGIECGDIGPKLGYNSMDNGYARFTHVTVPRKDMLSGFAQVAANGSYSKQTGAEKIAYGIMLDVRCRIVANSAYVLARALTIAIRYSYVRVQGGVPPRGRGGRAGPVMERAVIDYPSQRRILAPLLALAYGLHFTGAAMREMYSEYSTAVYGGDTSSSSAVDTLLPRLHMESAGLKALVTSLVADGMEACRKACGGHGFLSNAGFADLLTSYLPFCTLEGTREVLGQQTGRSLLKFRALRRKQEKGRRGKGQGQGEGHTSGTSIRSLLASISTDRSRGARLMSPAELRECTELLYRRVDLCLDRAERSIASYIRTNSSAATGLWATFFSDNSPASNPVVMEATLAAGVDLVAASEAFCEYLIVRNFAEGIGKIMAQSSSLRAPMLGQDTVRALQWLWQLLFLVKVEEHGGDFSACGVIPSPDDDGRVLDDILGAIDALCGNLRCDLVNLVEAWKISDTRLDSTLGRSDGKYVEALYEAALAEPLNQSSVSEGYSRYLKQVVGLPFTSSKL